MGNCLGTDSPNPKQQTGDSCSSATTTTKNSNNNNNENATNIVPPPSTSTTDKMEFSLSVDGIVHHHEDEKNNSSLKIDIPNSNNNEDDNLEKTASEVEGAAIRQDGSLTIPIKHQRKRGSSVSLVMDPESHIKSPRMKSPPTKSFEVAAEEMAALDLSDENNNNNSNNDNHDNVRRGSEGSNNSITTPTPRSPLSDMKTPPTATTDNTSQDMSGILPPAAAMLRDSTTSNTAKNDSNQLLSPLKLALSGEADVVAGSGGSLILPTHSPGRKRGSSVRLVMPADAHITSPKMRSPPTKNISAFQTEGVSMEKLELGEEKSSEHHISPVMTPAAGDENQTPSKNNVVAGIEMQDSSDNFVTAPGSLEGSRSNLEGSTRSTGNNSSNMGITPLKLAMQGEEGVEVGSGGSITLPTQSGRKRGSSVRLVMAPGDHLLSPKCRSPPTKSFADEHPENGDNFKLDGEKEEDDETNKTNTIAVKSASAEN